MSVIAEPATDVATTPVLTIRGRRAVIRLNRPAKLNRIEPPDLDALSEQLKTIAQNEGLRVLILTGTGRVFSAGYHLGDLDDRQSGRAPAREDGAKFEDVADALEDCRIPTVCALNGSVYGGSTDLALACDFRIGTIGSEMLMPAGKLGVHYYLTGMQRYVTRLGLAAAKRLFLTARPIDCEEMLRIGYLDRAVEKESFTDAVEELAGTLENNAPLSLQHMKRALNQIARRNVNLEMFTAGYKACNESEDLSEGIAAWKERRLPNFSGC